MNVRYENDLEKGAGFGLFHIHSINIPVSSPLSFSIQRSSDGKYLGNAAWLDAEERLQAIETTQADGACTLHVAPEITKHLDDLETYRFTLVSDGAQERAVLSIADTIIYGGVQQSGRIQGVSASPPTPIPVSPKPTPVEVAAPVAIPEPTASSALGNVVAGAAASGSRTIIAIIAGLVSMGLVVGAALMFLQILPNPFSSGSDTGQDASQEEAALSPMKQASAFFSTKGSYEEAFVLAKTMPSTEEGLDARFLLLELAAEGNILEAQMAVAEIYDPNHEAPTGTIMKDPEQAFYWYEQVIANPQEKSALGSALRTKAEAAIAKLPIIQ